MVNAKFDSGKARNTIQSLTSASKDFMLSSDAASSLDVPEFPYAGWVSSLPGLINSYGKVCELDIEWVSETISKFEEFNNESISQVQQVEVQSDFTKDLNVNKFYYLIKKIYYFKVIYFFLFFLH